MRSNEHGFTLIETLITVLIIGIITAIVIPNTHLVERLELRSQALKLASDIRYTQKLAMSQNASYMFKIVTKDNLYFIRKSTVLTGSEKKVYIPNKFKFAEYSTINIKYTSKGTPGSPNDLTGPGVGGTIYLLSKNYRVEITVGVATGRVRVYDISKK